MWWICCVRRTVHGRSPFVRPPFLWQWTRYVGENKYGDYQTISWNAF